MPRDNYSRRVARAAASGGGRSYRTQTPMTWYLVVFVICLLGVSLVAYSRYELVHPASAASKPSVPPTASNEWLAAVSLDACGKFVPSALPSENVSTDALASNGDGLVRIQPDVASNPAAYEGAHADLGNFLTIEGAELTPTLLSFPGSPPPTTTTTTTTVPKSKKDKNTTTSSSSSSTTTSTTVLTKPRNFQPGVTKCGSVPGYPVVETWSSPTATKGTVVPVSQASNIRFKNGEMITIGFLPKGAAVPQPPVKVRNELKTFLLEDPSGVVTSPPTTTSPSSTVVPSTTSSTSSSTTSTSSPTTTSSS